MKNIYVESSDHKCTDCGRGIDIAAMRIAQRAEFKRHGLCPECIAKVKEQKKQHAAERKAAAEAARAEAAERRAQNPSAANRIRALIEQATFNDEQLNKIMDFELTKSKTKISYPILKEIKDGDDWEVETYFSGALRYQKRPLNINGHELYMTNSMYTRNIPLVKKFLVEIGSLNDDTAEA